MDKNFILQALPQAAANELMKDLTKESSEIQDNFSAAFHAEKLNFLTYKQSNGNAIQIARPENERIYYLIFADKVPYLLVGLNPTELKDRVILASFARITGSIRGRAHEALMHFFEEILPPIFNERKFLTASLTSKGTKTMAKLIAIAPRGVCIELCQGIPYNVLKVTSQE